MSLFQPSVLKKYLSQQDTVQVQKAYKKYTKYFHNAVIQENIRNSKEEQFQEGFLRELFVDILGYTLNPAPSFNLTTELKNIRGAKKVDGAILKDGNALGVIELKGTNTKDLESIRQQAFDYKANQTGCIYVITSNFEKLRFYINNAVDYEEFNLFTLTHAEFEIFYLCLAKENILANKPLSIKEASVVEEENITKKFYSDYSVFKRELYRDLVKQNRSNIILNDLPEKTTKLILFQKSQKLIDRFLFILFAEDRGLLAPNSINTVLKEWKALADLDVEMPLYDRYKQYFGYLDTGRKGTDKKEEIFAYNGGLFQPDAILDAIIIDNELLYRHTLKLSTYDFESQVDVNILGHIFEHSLNEIESVNAEIEGTDFDKQKTKRKKDGVFYTPKYITKYIVDNTIGKLCTEKKLELGIIDEEYAKGRKNRQTNTIIKLDQQLKDYREWLLGLTICDPACGSGAFLNQALDFLIKEHAYLDELNKQLFGGFFVFPDIENQILEHNIYGVDLNEESIEIAKLSLWLRTAQPKRKLTSLNNNIKCGNSLIESKAIAGDKAFNWKEEFPEVFTKGGFDVIIGNPPYVRQELFKEHSAFLSKNYRVYSGKADLFTYFYEKGSNILKENGIISYISSGKFFEASYGKVLVKFLIENLTFIEVINFDDLDVFQGISAYPLIFTALKTKHKEDYKFNYVFVPKLEFNRIEDAVFNLPYNPIHISDFMESDFQFYSREVSKMIKKISNNSKTLKSYSSLPLVGVKTGFNDGFITIEETKYSKKYVFGKDLKRYLTPKSNNNIIFPYQNLNGEYELCSEEDLKEEIEYLNSNKSKLISRAIINEGVKKGNKKWFEYQQINKKINFNLEYIVYPNVSLGNNFTLSQGNVIDMTGFIIPANDKVLLAILNSKLIKFLMGQWAITRRGGYQEYKVQYLEKIPIKIFESSIKIRVSELVESIILSTDEHFGLRQKLLKYLTSNFKFTEISRKLQNWQELSFAEFITELNKSLRTVGTAPLTKKDEIEWMDLFEDYKLQVQTLKQEIDKTDKAIDIKVFELYGLSEEEIKIVEQS
ncbi:BREX-1 system adenine-specific DNA-methyltransferase PglX [Flavobacterium sp. I-SCBP12n]|uniref:site-specific DNA-methyltransferase (adenine-specific) n=1 Tax=Flavobacterium pygoscelis TaxID=2893176 RepID=A0A9X1XSL2_9FLAO|nr:DNA methyltransferase [Flavobacterium pygoscelis]MCK8142549.1 BREX-1 system adenine-specific DNA-methyltransferase PglX [Flavobacterium pygoscelis]